ncbi:UPF0725 protein EMB2204 [Arabidopsis lyrata subsp. lyrata]|uniref:UPF0725 protein EMB2204 n=1 Tax=Arabidopsis lyrata subsp. lyrata TaxID=81972 RepID=UPI000A29CD3C|nr:UPF0725 protein EMB2204 [Arabidopsis lyrata subsp. lyrata]|eukprot:XP_020888012.1 UPF0725 protein EMB2204 [Arabidopsis lyrata subsp. lyrata]
MKREKVEREIPRSEVMEIHKNCDPLASKEKVEKESKKVVVLNFGPGYMKQPWKWRSSENQIHRGITLVYANDHPHNPRRLIVLLYAKLGLHRYNCVHGKDLKLSSISTYIKSSGVTSATSYRITFDAKDPRDTSGSLQTFQTHVNERTYGSLLLSCTIACPLGEVTIGSETKRVNLHSLRPELPPENPFQDDTDRFYVLKKSEVKKNDWIRLYLELAVATTKRHHIKHGVANLKILRVALDTTPDPCRPSEKGLHAYDAIFYIRYTDSCKARAGEDGDRVAIVRRIWDEKPQVFRIVGRTESFRSLGNGESTTSPGSKDGTI